ncbi:redoxin domain-containing protein [Nocardia mexicana]|uniref:Peroxiredoxin n=1 Tax=Nocardia mexicana TaxID=279262 RepID=A0A370GML7_9NOCA|nr:peroxiredoxin [Nocardia mexicana]
MDVGDIVAPRELETIGTSVVAVPDAKRLVHMQFRRFAGCPICHLHLRSVARRHDEIAAAGVVEVVVFHSDAAALRKYQDDLPFTVVADPGRVLYTEFGVESSPTSVAHPRAMLAAARGAIHQRSVGAALGRGEDHFGLPADFLIAADGRVLDRKYGTHADDQWSVDDILDRAERLGSH